MEITTARQVRAHCLTEQDVGATVEFRYQKYNLGGAEAGTGRLKGTLESLNGQRVHVKDYQESNRATEPGPVSVAFDSVIGNISITRSRE